MNQFIKKACVCLVCAGGGLCVLLFITLFTPKVAIDDLKVITSEKGITITWSPVVEIGRTNVMISVYSDEGQPLELQLEGKREYVFKEGIPGKLYSIKIKDLIGNATYSFNRLFLSKELIPDMPIIRIETVDFEDPTYEIAEAPEGCFGSSVIDNEYKKGALQYFSQDLSYQGKVKIKVRGNTSSTLWNKKSYKIKLDNNVDLLGFKEDHSSSEWLLLNAGNNLNTFVGGYVSYLCGMELSMEMKYVNLYLNGDWKGMYVLIQSVSRETFAGVISEDGYLFENDAYYWLPGEIYFKLERQRKPFGYTVKYPKISDNEDSRLIWLHNYIQSVENLLSEKQDCAENYIDFESFAAWTLTRDIMGQGDAGGK